MRPWKLLDSTTVPGDGLELKLYCRGEEFSIKAGNSELMSSRVHGSEDALATLACQRLSEQPSPRVLIGGLGMGFTLAAALHEFGPSAEVVVAELVPTVVTWNRERLSALAGQPLDDPRVTVYEGDVGKLIRTAKQAYDAILLDVDNGPEGLTRKENDSLYSAAGLKTAMTALRPKGILGVWSISPDSAFSKRLKQAGYSIDELPVRTRGRRGARHMIWLGTKL